MAPTPVHERLWRVNYSGVLPGGEIFDHGIWMSSATTVGITPVMTNAQLWLTTFLASPALSVGASDIRHIFDAGVIWNRVRVQEVTPATGAPLGDPLDAAITIAGAGSGIMPPQCSVVVTLHNGRTIGRRRYNRFYLPPMEQSVLNTTGRVFSGLPGDLIFGVRAAEAAIEAASPASSAVYYGTAGHEVLSLVSCRCDDVMDTQRRRRNQLVPVITESAF